MRIGDSRSITKTVFCSLLVLWLFWHTVDSSSHDVYVNIFSMCQQTRVVGDDERIILTIDGSNIPPSSTGCVVYFSTLAEQNLAYVVRNYKQSYSVDLLLKESSDGNIYRTKASYSDYNHFRLSLRYHTVRVQQYLRVSVGRVDTNSDGFNFTLAIHRYSPDQPDEGTGTRTWATKRVIGSIAGGIFFFLLVGIMIRRYLTGQYRGRGGRQTVVSPFGFRRGKHRTPRPVANHQNLNQAPMAPFPNHASYQTTLARNFPAAGNVFTTHNAAYNMASYPMPGAAMLPNRSQYMAPPSMVDQGHPEGTAPPQTDAPPSYEEAVYGKPT